MRSTRHVMPAGTRGFTLLESMIALLVTSIGLLGIAKIQALAYANTGSASLRSLVAIQAAGLAASMHADRSYWANGLAPATFTITGTVISDTTLNATATASNYCVSGGAGAPCSGATLAAFDLHVWATALNTMLGNSNPITTVSCPTATIPINCTINVTWDEKAVSVNTQGASATATTFKPSYLLYVEP